jgi:hypothetical protein
MTHPAPCPAVATYERSGPAKAPRWIAKYVKGGTLLPPTFEGATELEATEGARRFWASEQVALAKVRAARGEAA